MATNGKEQACLNNNNLKLKYMSNFLERLKEEQKELQLNLNKLNSFIDRNNLSAANRILLKRQAEVMKEYNEILIVRLELND